MIDERDKVKVEWRPSLVEALELVSAIKDYVALQEASGQAPSAVLAEVHNELLQATARAGVDHPTKFALAQKQIRLRTRLPV